jgi:MoaA/NifB/PqqE/SkfB family radical SAM enzyme
LIDKKLAQKLAEVGNVTVAISIEGFEKETDERRGKGVYQKIEEAFKNLNEVGVPFGISITATNKNAELITSEKLIEYYWEKGVLYAWIFQLMPIGRASFDLIVTPSQRLKMFYQTKNLIKKGYFVADFWNCGMISEGCISAGRANGGGYLYIEWNGNVTPCVFNPYAVSNINEIYQRGGSLNEVLSTPFFEKIKKWQKDYGLEKEPSLIKNWILPCPIRDHFKEILEFVENCEVYPIDEVAKNILFDKEFQKKMIDYDEELTKIFDPIWKKEYLK